MPSGIYKRTDAGRLNMGIAKIGHTNGFKIGHKSFRTPEQYSNEIYRKNLSLSLTGVNKGRHSPFKGIKRLDMTGENHPKWIEDRSLIKRQLERNNPNDKQWKYQVYKRDNFKCKINNQDCKGRLEAHHILSWRDYPELRCVVNNGITLCQAHHPRKRKDEAELSPYFKTLVAEMK